MELMCSGWSEETAGLAFVRIRETEQQRLDGDEERFEAVPSEFHGLEQVLSKDPQLAISKGLSWFAQDREQFRFRGGSLLSRAFPNCTPEFAAALAELVKAGDDTEADFSLAVLQNYPGETSIYVDLKEIVSRFPHDDRKMSEVRISIDSTDVVSGEFGLADAWRVKKESLRHWLTDERETGKAFAEKHIAELDRMIASEWRRVEAERQCETGAMTRTSQVLTGRNPSDRGVDSGPKSQKRLPLHFFSYRLDTPV